MARNSKGRSQRSPATRQTSTRLPTRRQSHLLFKKCKLTASTSKRTTVDPSKLMYRSNVSGVIKTISELQFGKGHVKQLQKTPFWLMIDAIRVHKLDPNAYRKCDATVCRIIQTYNPIDEKFHIRGNGLPLRNSDIRFIFGIQCGKDKLDLTHNGKAPSDFIQRRCPNVGRISSKLIKDLLLVAIGGETERDEEDVAKLVCLYICAKLFFAVTCESIGWAFVRVIDKLNTLRAYDWTATIRNTVIGSLNEMHSRPEKVTGCVVALMFLLCEHTTIVQPDRENVLPRFCRWNIGKLVSKLKHIDLSAKGSIQVNTAKLNGNVIERYFVNVLTDAPVANVDHSENVLDVDPVSSWDGGVQNVDVEAATMVEPSLNCWQADVSGGSELKIMSAKKGDDVDMGLKRHAQKKDGPVAATGESCENLFPDLLDLASTQQLACNGEAGITDLCEQLKRATERINELEWDLRKKDERVRELDSKIASTERMLGAKTSSLFIGFDNVLASKDAEIERLKARVRELEEKVIVLEDLVDDREVHVVTQTVANDKYGHETPIKKFTSVNSGVGDGPPMGSVRITESESGKGISCLLWAGSATAEMDWEMNVGDCGDDEVVGVDVGVADVVVKGGVSSSTPNVSSLVRRVKGKERREFRLQDYEYPKVVCRGKQSSKKGGMGDVGAEVIYVADDIGAEHKTWNGFGMSRKHHVWSLLASDETKLLDKVYSLNGDGALIWDGGDNSIQVRFSDVRDLVQRGSIKGNVIDAYAAMLMEVQKNAVLSNEGVDTSYVFSSVCADMMRNPSAMSRTKYLNVQTKASRGHRYTHYPVYYANHWTLMVNDWGAGTWKHYNSLKPRRGTRDEHYNEALKVKQWLEDHYDKVIKPRLAPGCGKTPDFNGPLVPVLDCPQQKADTNDCAVLVCDIIRQYMEGGSVENTLDRKSTDEHRALMVKMFLNDPVRGVHAMDI